MLCLRRHRATPTVDHLEHLGGGLAAFAQAPDGEVAVALGEAPAGRIGQQGMMCILRRSVAQQLLQQRVNVRRGQQVDAARSLLAYLASPAAAEAKRKQGMEPA
eukprot:gene36697-47836_t